MTCPRPPFTTTGFLRSRVLLTVVPALAALAATMPVAAAITWDGGAGSGDFEDPNNWGATNPDGNADGVLDDGDLIFAGAVQTTIEIDTDYSGIDSIVFDSDADTFTIDGDVDGNTETLTFNDGASITNNSTVSGDMTIGSGLALIFSGSGLTITNTDANGDSDIVIDAAIDMAGGGSFVLAVGGVGDTQLNGNITGSGALINWSGSGTLTLGGNNTFDGGFISSGGTILLGHAGGLGDNGLAILGDTTLGATGGAISGVDNNIALLSGTTLTIGGAENIDLEGVFSGGGSVVIDMDDVSDEVTLAGANVNVGGGFTLTEGTVIADDSEALGESGDTFTVDATDDNAALEVGTNALVVDADVLLDGATSELSLNGNFAFDLAGDISGDGSLEVGMTSGVFVTLSGDNTFTGGVTIDNANAGITLGSDTALGTGDLTLTTNGRIQSDDDTRELANDVALGANTLLFQGSNDLDVSGVISGTGGLTVNTSGTLTLSGTNTYTGDTALSAGTLMLTSDDSIGNGGTFTITGGTLDVDGSDVTLDEDVVLNGNLAIADLGGGSLTLDGTFDLGTADRTITTSNNEVFEIGGVVSSTGQDDALIKAGTGILVLSGDNNAWNGGVQLGAGTLGIGHDDALGGIAMDVTGDASIYAAGGARAVANAIDLNTNTMTVTGSNDLTLSGAITSTGGTGSVTFAGTGTTTVGNGGNTYAGTTTISSGTVLASDDEAFGTSSIVLSGGSLGASGGTVTLDEAVAMSADSTITGGESLTLSGVVSGSGDLEVDMTAITDVLTLSGTNTGTGDVTIRGGMLTLSGGSALVNTVRVTLADAAKAGLTLSTSETIAGLSGGGSSGGNVTLGANTLTLGGDGSALFDYDGVIAGTGGVTVTGGTHFLDGDSTYTGTTTVSGGTLGGSGSIDGNLAINSGGTFAAGTGNTIGSFGVAGNLTLASGGTMEFLVGGSNLSMVDSVAATGTATLASGSTIDITVDQSAGSYIAGSSIYSIITATGGVTDNGVSITTDSATLTFFNLDGFEVDSGFTNGDTSFGIMADRASNAYSNPAVVTAGNNRAIGAALDSLISVADASPNGDAADLLAQLQALNAADLNTALEQLSPTVAAVPGLVAQAGTSAYSGVQSTYLAARRAGTEGHFMMASAATMPGTLGAGLVDLGDTDPGFVLAGMMQDAASDAGIAAATPEADDAWHVYGKLYGVSTEIETEGNRLGFEGDFFGVQGGIDRAFGDGFHAGVSIGFTQSDVDLLANRGAVESDMVRFGPYMTYQGDRWYADASVTMGLASYDQDRRIAIPGMSVQTARGDYDGDDISLYLGGGYEFDLSEAWTWAPTVSIQYSSYSFDGYTETGAGVNNLVVTSRDTDSLRSRVGVTFARKHDGRVGTMLRPEFSIGYEYEFEDLSDVEAQFAVGGSPFAVNVGDPVDGAVFVGAGLLADFAAGWSGYVRYDGLFGDGVDSHAVSGGFRLGF